MSEPQICVTVTGRTAEEIRAARDAAEADGDLVELRLDTMDRPDPAAALEGRRRPVVVTCRPRHEGGNFDGPESERRRILEQADALGAEFIDVEFDAGFDKLIKRRKGRGVVVSKHDFAGLPGDLESLLRAMRASGAEVVKLAVTTRRLSDLLPLLDAGDETSTVIIGMGPSGLATRVLAAHFRSRWTYAGDAVAPGQVPASRLLAEYQFRRIKEDSAIYGVIGKPIAHSLSPAMHNAGFAAIGMNAVYVPLEAESVQDFMAFARALDVRGASVTVPFKLDVMGIVDDLSPVAAGIGAVNTLVRHGDRWTGTNTDVDGFLAPLRGSLAMRGRRALVLGAGGAARSVIAALRLEGADVSVASRSGSRAQRLADEFGVRHEPWPVTGEWDLIVNATPVGSRAVPGTPARPQAAPAAVVYDLVYDPAVTPFLSAYAAAGADTIGGLEMLISQAERQFEIWAGQRPPAGLFASAVERALALRTPVRHP